MKKAFTLIEVMIVIGILGATAMLGVKSFDSIRLQNGYNEASNNIVDFLQKSRIYGVSNYVQPSSGGILTGEYLVPDGGYGFQIEKGLGTGIFALKLFYNKIEDVAYSSGTDVLIKEYKSEINTLYIDKIYGSGSNLAFPDSNGKLDILNTNTGTIIFRNINGDLPNDGSVFISSGIGDNNLKNIFIEFHMLNNGKKLFKRRVGFNRVQKTIVYQSCRASKNTFLDNCGNGEKWVTGF